MTTFNFKNHEATYMTKRLADFAKGTDFEGAKLEATGHTFTRKDMDGSKAVYHEYKLITTVNNVVEISG